ncbi:MAG: hypothetical protein LBG67_03990, partial [Campylobacteraceae bacterium]|nr:hypothetical protein [Campylobacteraceae bacterium]
LLMNYFKYTGLFVAILFGIFATIFAIPIFVIVNFANEILANIAIVTLFISPIIALIITSTTVSNMIIKSNGRVMTFGEIIKYTLCFSIVTAIVLIIILIILLDNLILSFGERILVTGGVVIAILFSTLITMFLVNIYFK